MTEIVIPAQPSPPKKSNLASNLGGRFKKVNKSGFDIDDASQRLTDAAQSIYGENDAIIRRTFWSTLRLLIAAALLIGLSIQAFFAMGRVVKTYYVVYPTSEGRAFDPEPVRWAESNYGTAKMVKYLNTHTAASDKVFVFRQSDINYYSHNDIAVFTDDHYANLFRLKSIDDLRSELWKEGVRYIAIPPYGLAEKNFSGFGDLMASPEHTALVFDEHNERLFEILPEEKAAPREVVRAFNLTQWEDREVWKATRFPMSLQKNLRTPLSKVERTANPPAVTLSRDKPPMADRELIDVLQPWDINLQTSPRSLGQSEFEVKDGIYNYSGRIKADGYIRLYMDLDMLSPDGTLERQSQLLWEGVLDDREVSIGGQTAIQFGADKSVTSAKDGRTARLYFTMTQGGYLTLLDFQMERLLTDKKTTNQQDFEGLQRAYSKGWSLDQLKAESGYVIAADEFSMEADGTLYVQQPSSAPRSFNSPNFILPSAYLEEMDTLKLNRASEAIRPIATVSMTYGGYGGLSPIIEGRCLDNSIGEDGTFSVDLPAVSLRMPAREDVEQILLPCIPITADIKFFLDRDFMRIPPDFRYADANISNLSLNVEVWKSEEQLTDIDYIQSNEVKSLSIASSPTFEPILTDF